MVFTFIINILYYVFSSAESESGVHFAVLHWKTPIIRKEKKNAYSNNEESKILQV